MLEEVLNMSESDFERGSPRQVRLRLPTAQAMDELFHNFKRTLSKSDDKPACSICLGDFEPGMEIIALKCHEAHIFHVDCLEEWSKKSGSCPLCRKDLADQVREEKAYPAEPVAENEV